MRKFCLMAFPLLLVVFLACGCSANRDADAMCEFDCDSVINLKLGTANTSDAVAYAPLSTNTMLHYINIDYDNTIINYEPVTGRVEALAAGSTRIKGTINGKTKSVQINVTQAIYCTSIKCTDFVMEYSKTADLFATDRNAVVINDGYNMGFTFESLTPEILSVDGAGIVTAKAIGQGQINIYAKSGVSTNPNQLYDEIYQTINITVMNQRENLSLSILDSNLNELSYTMENDVKTYELYSTFAGNLKYILKISSDQSLKNCWFVESSTSADCINYVANSKNSRLVTQNQNYIRTDDPKVVYQIFSLVDCGVDSIRKNILDFGQNFYYESVSEQIKLRVYQQTLDSDILVNVYNADSTSESNIIDTEGRYCLYEEDTGSLGALVKAKINNELCDSTYTVSCDNVTVTALGDNKYLVTCGKSYGEGSLTIKANDGGGVKVIKFYNYKVLTTIVVKSQPEVVLYAKDNYYLSANYEVYDVAGNVVEGCKVEVIIYDSDKNLVSSQSDKVKSISVLYPNFIVQFAGVENDSVQYSVVLHAIDTGYYSDVINVLIYA